MQENKYYTNKYLNKNITYIEKVINVDGKCYLALRENIFFPESYGQKGDRGTLEIDNQKYKVINTVLNQDDNEEVLVQVDTILGDEFVNKKVNTKLNWTFRDEQMQLHSAILVFHILLSQQTKYLKLPEIDIHDDGSATFTYQDNQVTSNLIEETYQSMLEHIEENDFIETYPTKLKKNERYFDYQGEKINTGGIFVDATGEIEDIKIEYKIDGNKQIITFSLVN